MSQKINEIDIRITKAFIKSVSFGFHPDRLVPHVSVSVELLTAGNKKISEVNFSTQEYYGQKLDEDSIPISVHNSVLDIMNLISPVIIRKINAIEGLIEQ